MNHETQMTDYNETEWKNCDEELPPCDGFYIVGITPKHDYGFELRYDGYGFIYEGIYRPVKFWRFVEQKTQIKRYGKINA
jgi:hypothetical protein